MDTSKKYIAGVAAVLVATAYSFSWFRGEADDTDEEATTTENDRSTAD